MTENCQFYDFLKSNCYVTIEPNKKIVYTYDLSSYQRRTLELSYEGYYTKVLKMTTSSPPLLSFFPPQTFIILLYGFLYSYIKQISSKVIFFFQAYFLNIIHARRLLFSKIIPLQKG